MPCEKRENPYEESVSVRVEDELHSSDYALFGMKSSTALSRKSHDSSVKLSEYPVRNEQILRNFEIFLPNFHFILPNFYFPVPWGIFVCSLELHDFLGRNCRQRRRRSSCQVAL